MYIYKFENKRLKNKEANAISIFSHYEDFNVS